MTNFKIYIPKSRHIGTSGRPGGAKALQAPAGPPHTLACSRPPRACCGHHIDPPKHIPGKPTISRPRGTAWAGRQGDVRTRRYGEYPGVVPTHPVYPSRYYPATALRLPEPVRTSTSTVHATVARTPGACTYGRSGRSQGDPRGRIRTGTWARSTSRTPALRMPPVSPCWGACLCGMLRAAGRALEVRYLSYLSYISVISQLFSDIHQLFSDIPQLFSVFLSIPQYILDLRLPLQYQSIYSILYINKRLITAADLRARPQHDP